MVIALDINKNAAGKNQNKACVNLLPDFTIRIRQKRCIDDNVLWRMNQ
jgi:hypothetical protein